MRALKTGHLDVQSEIRGGAGHRPFPFFLSYL